jgi:hypothetical protein
MLDYKINETIQETNSLHAPPLSSEAVSHSFAGYRDDLILGISDSSEWLIKGIQMLACFQHIMEIYWGNVVLNVKSIY